MNPEFANTALPEGDARYYFFLLFKIFEKDDDLHSSFKKNLEKRYKKEQFKEKEETFIKQYEQEVQPLIDSMFE